MSGDDSVVRLLRELFGRSLDSVFPILDWASDYEREWLRLDVVAGITVAASVIPEGLAYASLANLPPETGLYAGLLATIVYLFLGTSRQLIVGPTSALAILLASSLAGVASGSSASYASLVATTTVLVGAVAVLAWLLRLGFLVNFISDSVLIGFSAGAALYIISTQLGDLFGIEGASGEFYERVWYVATHLGEANEVTVAVGLGGIALFLLGKRLVPRGPNALVVVLLSIVAATVFGLSGHGVDLVGAVPSGLPEPSAPSAVSIGTLQSLVPIAVALFLLSYVQGIGAVETFARKHDYRADPEQELFATGAANVAAGLGSGFVVGGSMSRSALNDSVGGRTPLVSAVVAFVLLVVLLFFTGVFTNLPRATLAAVVIVAVEELIDVDALRRLYRVNVGEFAVAATALLGVLVLGMLWGIFLGIALSLSIAIGRSSDPHTEILGRMPGTDHYLPVDRHPQARVEPGVLVYRVDAELFYANASRIREDLVDRIDDRDEAVEIVVFDLSSSPTIDLSAAEALAHLRDTLDDRGIDLRFAGADHEVIDRIEAAGLDTIADEMEEGQAIADVVDERS